VDPDVVGEIEGWGVDPQGPAQAPPGPVQQLPEAGNQRQPRLDVSAELVDPDAAVGVQQPGAVQDGERADVVRPAELVRPQHEQVLWGQAVHAAWLGHDRPSMLIGCIHVVDEGTPRLLLEGYPGSAGPSASQQIENPSWPSI
jgi:hypothetical protein